MTDLPNSLFLLMRNGSTTKVASRVLSSFPEADVKGDASGMTIVADGVAIRIVWGRSIVIMDELGRTLYKHDANEDRTTISASLFHWHTTLFRTIAKAVDVDLDTVEGFA